MSSTEEQTDPAILAAWRAYDDAQVELIQASKGRSAAIRRLSEAYNQLERVVGDREFTVQGVRYWFTSDGLVGRAP